MFSASAPPAHSNRRCRGGAPEKLLDALPRGLYRRRGFRGKTEAVRDVDTETVALGYNYSSRAEGPGHLGNQVADGAAPADEYAPAFRVRDLSNGVHRHGERLHHGGLVGGDTFGHADGLFRVDHEKFAAGPFKRAPDKEEPVTLGEKAGGAPGTAPAPDRWLNGNQVARFKSRHAFSHVADTAAELVSLDQGKGNEGVLAPEGVDVGAAYPDARHREDQRTGRGRGVRHVPEKHHARGGDMGLFHFPSSSAAAASSHRSSTEMPDPCSSAAAARALLQLGHAVTSVLTPSFAAPRTRSPATRLEMEGSVANMTLPEPQHSAASRPWKSSSGMEPVAARTILLGSS